MKKYNKGFTLIELLVVIAIIGILSSVVLASLTSARIKAADAAIKSDVSSVMKQAEIYSGNNGNNYGVFSQATCPTVTGGGTNLFQNDSTMVGILNHAVVQGSHGSSCSSSDSAFAVAVGLKTTGQSWCGDSTGTVKQFAGTPAAAITANACN